jgi:hypothetical protein
MLIDTFTPDWQDHLIHQHGELAAGRRLFLLLDGAFLPNLYREVQTALMAPDDVALLFEQLPGCTDNTRSVSPFLIPYSEPSFLMTLALKKCSGWPMISAIETTETIAELNKRLAAWCVIENDGQRFNFRFPDTRRLPAMIDCLSAAQCSSLAGPAVRWSYIGRTVATLAKLEPDLHLDWCMHCLHNAVPSDEKEGINAALAWRETRLSNPGSDDDSDELF